MDTRSSSLFFSVDSVITLCGTISEQGLCSFLALTGGSSLTTIRQLSCYVVQYVTTFFFSWNSALHLSVDFVVYRPFFIYANFRVSPFSETGTTSSGSYYVWYVPGRNGSPPQLTRLQSSLYFFTVSTGSTPSLDYFSVFEVFSCTLSFYSLIVFSLRLAVV